MLQVENLTVKYSKDSETAAVNGLSFSLECEQWLMMIGPNGAGKSTAVEAISQCVPYSGDVLLCGKNLKEMKPRAIAREIGVVSQMNSVSYDYTVDEIVSLGRYAYSTIWKKSTEDSVDTRMKEEALEKTGLQDKRNVSVRKLSGGELQRVFLAQVLAQNPRILLLDEPTNHLDLAYQQQLFKIISGWLSCKEEPCRAVLSVVHDLNIAKKYGTHGILMSAGKCVSQGKIDDVMSRENLQKVYGTDVYGWMQSLLKQWE